MFFVCSGLFVFGLIIFTGVVNINKQKWSKGLAAVIVDQVNDER